jgi:putative transcription antitermination factor YqgF
MLDLPSSCWMSSSSTLSSPSLLSRAVEDAAATFTQESCSLLGVKSVGVDYGLVRTGVAVTVGYNPQPLEILVWNHPKEEKEVEKMKKQQRQQQQQQRRQQYYQQTRLQEDVEKEDTPVVGNITQIAIQVVEITKREQATQIIVGLPLHKNGTEGEQTNITRSFASELSLRVLQELGPHIPVYLCDERYTSKEAAARAHNKGSNRNMYGTLDAEAACIILEQFYHDNGQGAERVVVEDEELVQKFTRRWEQQKQQNEGRLKEEKKAREDRLRWRKEAILLDQRMAGVGGNGTGRTKKKRKKRKL